MRRRCSRTPSLPRSASGRLSRSSKTIYGIKDRDLRSKILNAAILELPFAASRVIGWMFPYLDILLHWLDVSIFGYFIARTPSTHLLRFAPHDPALSFHSATGSGTDYDSFMTEHKYFLRMKGLYVRLLHVKSNWSHFLQEGITLRRLIMASGPEKVIYGL